MVAHRRSVAPFLGALALVIALIASPADRVIHADEDPSAKYGPGLRVVLTADLASRAGRPGVLDADTLSVLIRASSDISPQLRALGVTVRSVVADGAVITADVPLAVLDRVARIRDLIAIDTPVQLGRHLDTAAPAVKADQLWTETTTSGVKLEGNGVLIGVIDAGFDLTHGDFKKADGSTKIVAVWDQEASGAPPTGFSYGNECQGAAVPTCPETDTNGHGTHVAGIAASSGRSQTSRQYKGTAPEADLAVVKSNLNSDRVIDAWNYLVNLARLRNQTLVINNSFGSQFGSHDGKGILDQALDGLAGPRKIFVVSAGNDAQKAIHQQASVSIGGSATFAWNYGSSGDTRNTSTLQIWSNGDSQVQYTFTPPATLGVVCPTTVYPPRSGAVTCSGGGYNLVIQNILDPASANSLFQLDITRSGAVIPASDWTVLATNQSLTSTVVLDGYLPNGSATSNGTDQFTTPTRTGLIAEPGTALNSLTVGAFVSRVSWPTINQGQVVTVTYSPAPAINSVASFSSVGPTRDGRTKPEFTAPGQGVVSAKSAQFTPQGFDAFRVTPDGFHYMLEGTSMAAPVVSGIAALFIQAMPDLTPVQIRDALVATADGGRVNALAAYNRLKSSVPTVTPTVTATPTATPTPTSTPTATPTPGNSQTATAQAATATAQAGTKVYIPAILKTSRGGSGW